MATPTILIVPDRYKSGVLYSQLPESGAVDFGVTRATTAFRTNASGILESVASGVPRLDYPAAGGCPSLLVEPAATNLVLRSEEFDDAVWAKVQVGSALAPVVTANAGVAPNGTTTADRVVFNTVGTAIGDRSIIRQSITSVDAKIGTIYMKSNTGSNQTIGFHDGVFTNLVTLTNQWQRFQVNIGTANVFFGLESRGTSTPGVRDILIWGAQLETGSVATSYIPTVAATATRNADVISKTGVSGFIGQAFGTLYAEVDVRNTASLKRLLYLSDGTTNNEIRITLSAANSGDVQLAVRLNSTLIVNSFSPTNVYSNGVFKIAAAYKSADYVLYINGSQILTSSAVGNIPACNRIDIGNQLGTSNFFNDRIRAAAIYTTRLSNTELAQLTSL
jgi:hypothetical protein